MTFNQEDLKALIASAARLIDYPEGSRVALEVALRELLDDDDACSAVQIALDLGWRPPDEPAEVHPVIETLRSGKLAAVAEWRTDDKLFEPQWTCSLCGGTEFRYEESHPSTRIMEENGPNGLTFYSHFEWFDGDDNPGVVCEGCDAHVTVPEACRVDFR